MRVSYSNYLTLLILIILSAGCVKEDKTLFTLMDSAETGISFLNELPYTEEFNTYTYRNFYNGGGVALGDINNDGLLDIYFTGNIVDNKLFLNKGNWQFEDITEKANVACPNVWSTGATMVDINGDGLLDIYVCKAGKPGGDNRHNELFINQGDLTFKEESKAYGLDLVGLSIHAAFFDYDRDGDLDCYLLSNSIRSVAGFNLKEGQRLLSDPEGNKFLRNDNGYFKDISQEAGIYSSNIGYGLGITLSDFNQDNWPDIFISNDFFERDYLYLNNQDGTFQEVADKSFSSLSMGSMGADASDVNNDLLPDLFVTEMLPQSLERKKTKAQYETWDKYTSSADKGYHHQFSRNVLQRSIGNGKFLELGRMSGVAATEWSWASLIQDFDNDGLKDLFISNGIYKDLLDKDYINYFADDAMVRSRIAKNEKVLTMLIDSMPSQPQKNYMYKNEGNMEFTSVADEWGLGQLTFSNGSAYGDLDNDGDLDLIVNNVNMPSFVYRNNLDTTLHKSIRFKLNGEKLNTYAIGTKIIIKHAKGQSFIENYTSRGFESSIDSRVHIGLGNVSLIDSVWIIWPDSRLTLLTNLQPNQLYEVNQSDALAGNKNYTSVPNLSPCDTSTIPFTHRDIRINLFARERMLVEMSGFDGPAMAVADINGDQIDDVFCGGGRNQAGVLYLSNGENLSYQEIKQPFAEDDGSETVKALFFDSDNDGDLDLYVAHGGKTFSNFTPELNDVLYINDGKGNFEKKDKALDFPFPMYTGDVAIADINKDGLNDIVVVEKMKTSLFGLPGSGFIFYNQGNNRYQHEVPEMLKEIGMLSAVVLSDVNGDSWPDLVVAGKWMPIRIFYNQEGRFTDTAPGEIIPQSSGLWNTLYSVDLDQDGDEDILCGNEGLNNFYAPNMKLFINDFDGNGYSEQIICQETKGKYYPIHDIDEMYSQLPVLKKKFTYYRDIAKVDITELFSPELIESSRTYVLDELKSIALLNENGTFKKVILPAEAQYSSIHAILARDKDQDGNFNILVGGNNYQVKPQFGRQDASMGWLLKSRKEGGALTFGTSQPLFLEGQIRSIHIFKEKIIVGINNGRTKICEIPNE